MCYPFLVSVAPDIAQALGILHPWPLRALHYSQTALHSTSASPAGIQATRTETLRLIAEVPRVGQRRIRVPDA